jgi:UDP-N-acetylmuramoyl-tripeptide--D-alanyl-D-alanine ligase
LATSDGSMTITVLHVITGLSRGTAERALKRLVLAGEDSSELQQVVVTLKDGGVYRQTLQDAGVALHSLNLDKASRLPGAFLRLVALMRSVRPDVVMTWLYHADALGTLAMIMSGVGVNRLVWNVSCSNPLLSNDAGKARRIVRLLAWLSPLPGAVVSDSPSGQQVYEALGYRARRWVRMPPGSGRSNLKRISKLYRRLQAPRRWPIAVRVERLWREHSSQARWQLKIWSARIRRRLLTGTTFVAVTGSCGKTVTTLLTDAILATDGPTHRRGRGNVFRCSVRNVLSTTASSKYCLQEVSAQPPGSIAQHVRVLRPNIAIVTTIGSDHYKSFRSLEATAREKGKLVETLSSRGVAILNVDDPHIRAMADRTRARVLTFGRSAEAEVRATEVSSAWPNSLKLTVSYGDESHPVQTQLVGEHWATAVLGAIACGIVCGIDLRTCAKVVGAFRPILGRYSVHANPGGPVYVLDTQKAPLWTIAAGLAFVAEAKAPRKTVVFGTISDYGGASGPKYRKLARQALDVADRVIFVGPNAGRASRLLRDGALRARLFTFQTSYQASAFLADGFSEELIYIKASTTDHLERIMLLETDDVVCWRERCGKPFDCSRCPYHRTPHAPPFGLAKKSAPITNGRSS